MISMETKNHKKERIRAKRKKYFECERCGYVTIVKDSECPICAKEGIKVKLT
jgi:rubrerythrin